MKQRWNGSLQSSNTPTINQPGTQREDHAMYRCMVTKVLYTDDPNNITQNSRNPTVLYECIILGGFASGQLLFPCRLASWFGGDDNYSERNLSATTKNLSTTPLADHDGDIVWVQFNQGHDGYPTIIATDKGLNDNVSGTASADGPRSISQFNGLYELINNKGEYTIIRQGGSKDPSTGRFTPATGTVEARIQLIKDNIIIDDGSRSITINKTNDQVIIKTAGGGEINITAGKISIGAAGTELLQQISDELQKISDFMKNTGAKHTHIGNLGYDTAPPDQAADYTQLGSDLADIKGKVDGIKGTL